MPRKPKRPCSYPGCPKLVDGQYCEEHKRLVDKQYNEYGRDNFTKNFYKTPEWLHARKQQLNQHPFCEECLKEGKRTRATMVDHIVPIKQGGDKFALVFSYTRLPPFYRGSFPNSLLFQSASLQ